MSLSPEYLSTHEEHNQGQSVTLSCGLTLNSATESTRSVPATYKEQNAQYPPHANSKSEKPVPSPSRPEPRP